MCLHTRSTCKPACLLFTIPAFPSTRAETRTGAVSYTHLLPRSTGRKVGTTSGQYGPYAQGCTRTTMPSTEAVSYTHLLPEAPV